MSYKKVNWNLLNPVDVWNAVRTGELKVFPNNYLNKDICKELIRTLVIDELHLSRKEILKLNFKFLAKYKLGGTRKFLPGGIYGAINFCFPELKIKEWELPSVANGFWDKEKNRTRFVKWVAKKENLNLSKMSDIRKFYSDLFISYGGSRALKHAGSLYNLLKPAVSKNLDFHEWNLIKVNSWNESKTIEAVHWLIEEKLKWSHEEVYNKLSASVFYKNDLGGMLSKFCNNSPLKALQIAYPGEYDSLKNTKPIFFV